MDPMDCPGPSGFVQLKLSTSSLRKTVNKSASLTVEAGDILSDLSENSTMVPESYSSSGSSVLRESPNSVQSRLKELLNSDLEARSVTGTKKGKGQKKVLRVNLPETDSWSLHCDEVSPRIFEDSFVVVKEELYGPIQWVRSEEDPEESKSKDSEAQEHKRTFGVLSVDIQSRPVAKVNGNKTQETENLRSRSLRQMYQVNRVTCWLDWFNKIRLRLVN